MRPNYWHRLSIKLADADMSLHRPAGSLLFIILSKLPDYQDNRK